jgi:hypothetical protein
LRQCRRSRGGVEAVREGVRHGLFVGVHGA